MQGERELDRATQALLALHDLGSRENATANGVKRAMLDEGFTLEEIAEAARSYGSHRDGPRNLKDSPNG